MRPSRYANADVRRLAKGQGRDAVVSAAGATAAAAVLRLSVAHVATVSGISASWYDNMDTSSNNE